MIHPDLHLHTTASDGIYTPTQLARLLQRAGITLFSITDHDTLSGLKEASGAAYDRGLAFIPGVEISAEGEDEVHILGYGVKADDPVLLSFFHDQAKERQQRILRMAARLEELGMPVPVDELWEKAGGSIGRPHLARAMVAQGYVSDVKEAFDRFLGNGRPAYIPREKLPASRAISILKSRGAVPVLAHPGLLNWPMERLLPLLSIWQDAGLMGIEVYHPANRGSYTFWDRLAREKGLMVTGGSDFHDGSASHGQIGETVSAWPNALDDAWRLYRAAHH